MIEDLNIKLDKDLKDMTEEELLYTVLLCKLDKDRAKKLAQTLMLKYFNLSNVIVAPDLELLEIEDVDIDICILLKLIMSIGRKISWENHL